MSRPDWAYNYQNRLPSREDAVGKTVSFVDDGYESVVIGFEDETFIEVSLPTSPDL